MSLELAIRMTEILLALAFLQQSAEHFLAARAERWLFVSRFLVSLLLLFGVQTQWVCLVLAGLALLILRRFQGPYNGGSDRMSLLILCCVSLVHFVPTMQWREVVFGYLALQVVLSYFMAGWVKILNPAWRSGLALQDVFGFSAYPVSEGLRDWADWPRLLWGMSWLVMVFELLFPLALLTQTTLIVGLVMAAIFHVTNACLFGLNRFLWIWLAAYPSLLWLQQRLVGENFVAL